MDAESGPAPCPMAPRWTTAPRPRRRRQIPPQATVLRRRPPQSTARSTLRHFTLKKSEVRLHAHGENHGVAGKDMFAAGNGISDKAALFVETAFLHIEIVHALDAAVPRADGGQRTAIVDTDAFGRGPGSGLPPARAWRPPVQTDHVHFGRAQTAGGKRAVKADAASAHDHDPVAHGRTFAERARRAEIPRPLRPLPRRGRAGSSHGACRWR